MTEQETWGEEDTKIALDIFGGSLTDIKEERTLIPPTQNVKLRIVEVDVLSVDKTYQEKTWKTLKINFSLEDGVVVNDVTKYKGSRISAMICYYANPKKYDYSKPFFSKGQFLLGLKQLVTSTEIEAPQLVEGGVSDDAIHKVAEDLKDKLVLANVVQTKRQAFDPKTKKWVPTDELQNEVKFFKPVPDTDLV